MDINTQIILFLISFILGFIFFVFSHFIFIIVHNKSKIYQFWICLLLVLDFDFLYLFILYKLSFGMFHIYFLFMFILGFFVSSKCIKYVKRFGRYCLKVLKVIK